MGKARGTKGRFGDQIGRAQSELQSRFDLVCRLLLEKKNARDDRKRQEASAVLCSPFMAETNGAGALVNKEEIHILLNLKRVMLISDEILSLRRESGATHMQK